VRQGLIVDLFAGGGGASIGIEQALGRPVDVAINHSAEALAVHEANHPMTRHLRGDIWGYAPDDVTGGAPVDFLWASPTCTFFSQAKGGPLDRKTAMKVRSLAWVLRRWGASRSAPRVWAVENVKQFEDWGPLDKAGKPIKSQKGRTFKRWVRELERLGYKIEWRTLAACDYGAPTTRERIFVIGRRDGGPIVWPEPTHGPGLLPYRSAAECIDWRLPVPSIFGRKKPLVDNTLRRIVRGVDKFVLGDQPYFVGDQIAATLIQRGFGERKTQAPRCMDIREPLRTVVAGGTKHCLVVAFVAKHFGGNETPGQSLNQPFGAVTCKDHHALILVSGLGDRREDVRALMDRFSDVRETRTLFSPKLDILDIGMRWFTPRELARAQGFPDSYQLDVPFEGAPLPPTKQVLLVGNSVASPIARAIVEANVGRRAAVAA
jgi:DNA (cytosine-5)-methyltransferase 1